MKIKRIHTTDKGKGINRFEYNKRTRELFGRKNTSLLDEVICKICSRRAYIDDAFEDNWWIEENKIICSIHNIAELGL